MGGKKNRDGFISVAGSFHDGFLEKEKRERASDRLKWLVMYLERYLEERERRMKLNERVILKLSGKEQ